MGIGPFTTYAPPGVYTQTVLQPAAGQLLTGVRIPVFIGTGRESLSQTDFEMVRGSSSQADTPIFGEDVSSRWVLSGPNNNPVLGVTDGNKAKFKVRNFPVVDGSGAGRVTYDSSKISVSVNGSPAAVSAVDGPNGSVTLLVPPAVDDFVTVNYYFHRKDTRITDDVSSQVSDGPAVLIAPKAETYSINASSNKLVVYVNDSLTVSTITLSTGLSRFAVDVANEINAANVAGLSANVIADNQGLFHLFLTASGNVTISNGTANGALGFTTGNSTSRNKSFVVFNGPIVDGSDGGITATDPSKVVVKVNGAQVLARSVDGANRTVVLSAAPPAGSIVTIDYWFNSWQDTFDYLPNSNVLEVANVGIAPGRRDYINGLDFVVINDKDQAKIQWGTAFTVVSGVTTGLVPLDGTQIVGMLVDDRIYGTELTRYVDPGTSTINTSKFILPLTPTSGNGRDTPLSISVFNATTNGRMDLPTDNPNLVTAYTGKTWRDAYARGPVAVVEVDGIANTISLRDPVPGDYSVYATFWYNRIADDLYTFKVITPGPTGVGQYSIFSALTDSNLFGVKFGSKTALPETVQWPSGVEEYPDAFIYGGLPVAETITVTFNNSLSPARNASITNENSEPYDLYVATSIFGNIVVDGGAAFGVNLATAFPGVVYGQPVSNPLSFQSTDRLQILIDVTTYVVNVSAATSVSQVASAINAATGSTNATAVPYGSSYILAIKGTNVNASDVEYKVCGVSIQVPTGPGLTDGSFTVGLTPNLTSSGSFNAINQAAQQYGTQSAPFAVTTSVNSTLVLNVDGVDFHAEIPSGVAVPLSSVVASINDSYLPFANASAQSVVLPSLYSLANSLKAQYNLHRVSTVFHSVADNTNVVASPSATTLGTLITLLNDFKTAFNAHIASGVFHQTADTTNTIVASNASDLQSASVLARAAKAAFNSHLLQLGSHGYNDTTNVVTLNTVNPAAITNAVGNGGLIQLTVNGHGLTTSDYVVVSGVTGTVEANGAWQVTVIGANDFTLNGSTFTNAYVAGGTFKDSNLVIALLNDTKTKLNTHYLQSGVHLINDVVNTIVAANATDLTTSIVLVNQLKSNYNSHRSQSGVHGVNDTTNVVTVADAVGVTPAGFALVVALAENIAVNSTGAFNSHRLQLQGGIHVHSTNDLSHTVSAAIAELVARTGADQYVSKLVLSSLVNTPNSAVVVRNSSTAATTLGLSLGAVSSRIQPTAARIAAALNYDGTFKVNAASWPVTVQGLGNFLRIDSLSSGLFSTLGFQSTSSTAFIPSTNVGIVPGMTRDNGEDAVAGYTVVSSTPGGSSGVGVVGQTYMDMATGLRFTILPASAGDYSNGGSFTMTVGQTFTCDSAIPIKSIPGVETTVFNTVNTNPDTTAVLRTYIRTGNSPKVGDVYYVSYFYGKTSLDTQLFQDLKKIQQNYGSPTPDYPLSLAARLAILNGAVIVGLKQVLTDPVQGNAPTSSYISAIDDLKKPLSGNIKPDVITPLATDPSIFAYLNQHCVFMSSPRQEGERIGVVGTAIGTTPIGAAAIGRGLQSELMVVVYPDSFVVTITDDAGNLADRLVDGSYIAASLAGSSCSPSIDVATPWTRRQIAGVKSVGRILDPTEANQVAVSGITIVEQVNNSLRVRHGLTTRTDNVITRTPSVTLTIQYVQQTMRSILDPYIGQKFTQTIPKQVEQSMAAAFQKLINQQIVAKVAGIVATVDANDPTVLRTEAIYVPVFPLEYIVSVLSIRIRT